uniref:Putative farnesoic acid 0-methyl transferase n=1 Tax=Corethrella appendiculata TaxID=1370023 RepID=U5EKY3_9DIPT
MTARLREVILILTFLTVFTIAEFRNKFEAVSGCKQFNAVDGYHHSPEFLPIEHFRNVGKSENSTYFRFGIVCESDAFFRFANKQFPFRDSMHEIVLGGWSNTASEIRRQRRDNHVHIHNDALLHKKTPSICSKSEPVILKIEFFHDGYTTVTKEGELYPFLEFADSVKKVNFTYVSFGSLAPHLRVIYFFDCPFQKFKGLYDFDMDVRINELLD